MKKLTVYAFAFVAMALAMTSCNKDENVVTDTINASLEDNEIMNDAKMHQVGTTNYFDENDRVRFIDQSGRAAIYSASTTGSTVKFNFVQNVNNASAFNAQNGPIVGIFPWNIGTGARKVTLPRVQNSVSGEIYKQFPLYAEDVLSDNYIFRNLCGVARLVVTADVAIDSISITTDQYVNGEFDIDMTDSENPALIGRTNGHATKTVTMKISNPVVPAANVYSIALPPAEYNVFNITFYSGNTQYVKHSPAPVIPILRHLYTTINVNLTGVTFTTNPVGTVNGEFAVSATQNVRFAKGNLQYIAFKAQPFWQFANNQWDCLDILSQRQDYSGDRDLISWGANRYNVANNSVAGNAGNAYTIWNRGGAYSYLPGTDDLAGINDWGSNPIENGGNGAWRTLTAGEWDYLLNTRDGQRFLNAQLTIGTESVKGLIIFPNNYTTNYAGVNDVNGAYVTITLSDWFTMEDGGCVFLPANNYGRDATGRNHFVETGDMSYYWSATADSDTEANAVKVSKTAGMSAEVIAKRCGAYIRLVQNI